MSRYFRTAFAIFSIVAAGAMLFVATNLIRAHFIERLEMDAAPRVLGFPEHNHGTSHPIFLHSNALGHCSLGL